MRYVKRVLQPGEHVLHVGRMHGIVYLPALIFLFLGAAVLAIDTTPESGVLIYGVSCLFTFVAAFKVCRIWFRKATTELAVTERRIIYKTGFVARQTAEMNINRIEAVEVEQSIFGRLLGFGTVHICGAGAGIETLTQIARPLELRSSITAPALDR